MSQLFALVAPMFSTTRTYAEMLSKLAGFAFYETYLITFFLRDIPEFGRFFRSLETFGSLGDAIAAIPSADVLNLAGLAIAMLVAVATYAFHFHDRLSDLFRIRSTFDRTEILLPLARLVGVTLSDQQLISLSTKRHTLMRQVFYKYASSRAESPLVDKHDIEHALSAWSWFWVGIEGAGIFTVALIIACVFTEYKLAGGFFVGAAIFVGWAFLQYPRLAGYARPQIEAIADDPTASREVRAAFDAL